jgi:hypothetical protein
MVKKAGREPGFFVENPGNPHFFGPRGVFPLVAAGLLSKVPFLPVESIKFRYSQGRTF